MEPKHERTHDILDTVIAESLRANMGDGPSSAVWGRILNDITPPPAPTAAQERWNRLRQWFQGPIVRTAFIFALLLIVVGKPAISEYTRVTQSVHYPHVTTVLPTVPQQRPLPEPEQELVRANREAQVQRSERLQAARRSGVPLPQLRVAETP